MKQLVAVAVVLSTVTGCTSAQSTSKPPVVKTAPEQPEKIPGYRKGSALAGQLRATSTGTIISQFPVFQNHCGSGLTSTRWRSLGGAVTVKLVGSESRSSGAVVGTDTAGLIITKDACRQPLFLSADGEQLVTDVSFEYIFWTATP